MDTESMQYHWQLHMKSHDSPLLSASLYHKNMLFASLYITKICKPRDSLYTRLILLVGCVWWYRYSVLNTAIARAWILKLLSNTSMNKDASGATNEQGWRTTNAAWGCFWVDHFSVSRARAHPVAAWRLTIYTYVSLSRSVVICCTAETMRAWLWEHLLWYILVLRVMGQG